MTKRFFILYALIVLLLQNPLWASDEEMEWRKTKEVSSHKTPALLMTHQEVANKLSQGMFLHKKIRVQLALAPAAPEYLTEEFINLVQNFSQKMNIYEKCYVIRAMMKFPAPHLAMLKDFLDIEKLQLLPNSERVSFIKKLAKIEPSQWPAELKMN